MFLINKYYLVKHSLTEKDYKLFSNFVTSPGDLRDRRSELEMGKVELWKHINLLFYSIKEVSILISRVSKVLDTITI